MRPPLVVILAAVLAACGPAASPPADPSPVPPAEPTGTTVSGTVTYRERIALPPEATVIVTIRERGDATRTIARTAFGTGGRQVPIPFELEAPGLDPSGAYVAEARIEQDGRVHWTTDEPAAVRIDGPRSEGVEILLTPSTATEPPSQEPYERARREGVTFRARGQEPGWLLDVYGDAAAPDSLVYQANYATERFAFTDVTREASQQAVTYRAAGFEATVEDSACRDAMSGEPFPATVAVRHTSGDVWGCGRALD